MRTLIKKTLKASKSYIQEHKRNKGKLTKRKVMIFAQDLEA